jgi:hypothetical protein
MSSKLPLVCVLAAGLTAGCATWDRQQVAAPTGAIMSPVMTDAPSIDNADAAGWASVPGVHTGSPPAVIVTPPPAASPVIVVPPPR